MSVTSAPMPAGSPRAMARRGGLELDGDWLLVEEPMLRWLLLGGLVLGLATGINKGWIELRWGRLLGDLGLPYVADPADLKDCPPASSSARQAL